MLFIKRAKILSTRLYEFFEGGNINTIVNSPDKLVRRTNQATFSDLRKSGIHQAFGEFVVHTCIVAVLPRRVEKAASRFHRFTLAPSLLGMSALPPSGHVQCTSVCPLCAKSGHCAAFSFANLTE
jgi:hypothetical protein